MKFKDFVNSIDPIVAESTSSIDVVEEVTKEIYEDISVNKIVSLIKEHHDVKVTDTLIEKYSTIASSNYFSIDPVITEMRMMNSHDRLIEGKINYTLSDGSIVAISEATQSYLNNILKNDLEVVAYMQESEDNFLKALALLGV